MKKRIFCVAIMTVILLTSGMFCTSCSNGEDGTVTDVIILHNGTDLEPNQRIDVTVGTTAQFTVKVTATGSASKSVTWKLSGGNGASTIVNGLLTVGSEYSNTELTITATAVANAKVEASIRVRCTPVPAVSNVTITTTASRVNPGGNLQMAASVSAVGGAPETVTWAIDSGHQSGTGIDAGTGLLTVDAAEVPNTEIVVTATSTFNPARSASKTITVSDPNIFIIEDFGSFNIGSDFNTTTSTGNYWYDPKPPIYGTVVESDLPESLSGQAAQVTFATGGQWNGGFGNSGFTEPVSSETLATYTKLTYYAKLTSGTSAALNFAFQPSPSGGDSSVNVSGTVTDEWQKFEVNLSQFNNAVRNNGARGWLITTRAAGTFILMVDRIILEK